MGSRNIFHHTDDRTPDITVPPEGDAAGYASRAYAESLAAFGEPTHLPASGGWLLKRDIPGTLERDAMGCYPIFTCRNWGRLADDLASLEDSLASVTLVADPFGEYSERTLRRCFPDLCVRYKEHYVIDLNRVSFEGISAHHRRNVRRGLREVETQFCANPSAHLSEWRRLYENLVRRHNITGVAAFSGTSFHKQMHVSGLIMQRAVHADETVGMALWFLDRGVAWYHLGAYSGRGYELRASYALFWAALEYFRGRAEMVALGGAAGAQPGSGGGLDRFKAGWATGSRPALLCGRILSPDRYARLTYGRRTHSGGYFPAYRSGEFR